MLGSCDMSLWLAYGTKPPMDLLIKVLHELRAIVGKHGLKRIGKDFGYDRKEFPDSQRSMALSGPGKGESGVVISKRDDVAPHAI